MAPPSLIGGPEPQNPPSSGLDPAGDPAIAVPTQDTQPGLPHRESTRLATMACDCLRMVWTIRSVVRSVICKPLCPSAGPRLGAGDRRFESGQPDQLHLRRSRAPGHFADRAGERGTPPKSCRSTSLGHSESRTMTNKPTGREPSYTSTTHPQAKPTATSTQTTGGSTVTFVAANRPRATRLSPSFSTRRPKEERAKGTTATSRVRLPPGPAAGIPGCLVQISPRPCRQVDPGDHPPVGG